MDLNKLTSNIEQWARDRNLHTADPAKQMLKVTEEIGEVAAALARGDEVRLEDGIGDSVVTLIVLAQQNGLTFAECVDSAYQEIKARKGKMVDGVFVKEEDLQASQT